MYPVMIITPAFPHVVQEAHHHNLVWVDTLALREYPTDMCYPKAVGGDVVREIVGEQCLPMHAHDLAHSTHFIQVICVTFFVGHTALDYRIGKST